MTLAAIVGVCLLTASPSIGARVAVLNLAAAVQESTLGQQPASVEPGPQKERKCGPAAHSKPAKSKNKSVSSSKAKKQHGKHPVAEEKPSTSPKIVVKDGGATDPTITISPGLNQQQASRQRQSAEQLLARADENLKKISGQNLNSSQQEMVQQIQQYMQQAKAAGNTGDLARQHNLALKAQLLSEELVKP